MKNVIQSKIFRIIFILALILTVIAFIRIKYVFIDGKIYRNDVVDINVDANNKSNINELNRCDKIEKLSIRNVNDNVMSEIKFSEKLYDLMMVDVNIGDIGISKLNDLAQLEHIMFVRATLDLTNIDNDSLEKLSISLSDVAEISRCVNCSSLTELFLKEVTIEDSIICTENKEYVLKNSSDFSVLDCIKLLKIYRTKIDDISGILDMKSLEKLIISEGSISASDRMTLEKNGISVIEMSSDEEQ